MSGGKGLSEKIKEFLSLHPYLKECIRLNIVNYSALSRYIANKFKEAGLNVSTDAIKMSLIRLRKEVMLEKEYSIREIEDLLAKSIVELQTNLIVITAKKSIVDQKINELIKLIGISRFFHIAQGTDNYTLILPTEYKRKIIDLVGEDNILDVVEEQAAITLISPESIVYTPGFTAYITSTLASNNINITQIISCYKDTILVVNRSDLSKAYNILEKIISTIRASKR